MQYNTSLDQNNAEHLTCVVLVGLKLKLWIKLKIKLKLKLLVKTKFAILAWS